MSSIRQPTRLSSEETASRIKSIPEWILADEKIVREFKLGSFRESIDFVNGIADLAEQRNHHPEICVNYDKVRVELSTHKVGGLSDLDFELAAAIDKL